MYFPYSLGSGIHQLGSLLRGILGCPRGLTGPDGFTDSVCEGATWGLTRTDGFTDGVREGTTRGLTGQDGADVFTDGMVLQMVCVRVPLWDSLEQMVLMMERGRAPLGDSLDQMVRMFLQME